MLKARKSVWFDKLFSIYNRNLIRRRFHEFRVDGLTSLERRDKNLPLIVYSNHSSWWDGLIIYQLAKTAEIDFFVMMEERQLSKLPLFRRLGAFSVIREKPRAALESINYAVEILAEKSNRCLLIFPQGEIQPNDIRPLNFYGGISKIIEKLGVCQAVPIAIRLEFLGKYKPEMIVKIGEIKQYNSNNQKKISVENLQMNLTAVLDELKREIISGEYQNYHKIC